MIDWFLSLSLINEIAAVVAIIYIVWSMSMGFVIGIMCNGAGNASMIKVLGTAVLGAVVAPFAGILLIIRRMVKK